MKTVGVFGTWRAQPGSQIYDQANEIGMLCGSHGFRVLTGAYSGVMEAAPRGAKSAGGQTTGYTWAGLDGELEANEFLDDVEHFESVVMRAACLIRDSDICVFFPGRTGTVAELALATEARAKGEMACPIILVGNYWENYFEWLNGANKNLESPSDAEEGHQLYQIIDQPDHITEVLKSL